MKFAGLFLAAMSFAAFAFPSAAAACDGCPFVEISQENFSFQEAILTINTGLSATVDPWATAQAAGNMAVLSEWGSCTSCGFPSGKITQTNHGDQRAVLTANGPGISGMNLNSIAVGNSAMGFVVPKP